MRTTVAALIGLLWPGSAWAFCGTYVGGVDSTPSNRASQVAVARDGSATTLTLFNDWEGDFADFGLLIPVPPGFDGGNLRLADATLLATLDAYSAPRMVAYDCEAFYDLDQDGQVANVAVQDVTARSLSLDTPDTGGWDTAGSSSSASSSSSSSGCGGGVSGSGEAWFDDGDDDDSWWSSGDTGDTVVVQDEVELGEYTATVLSAEDGGGLQAWLSEHGFAASEAAVPMLDEYIDGGSWFVALAIDVQDALTAPGWLTPLQLGYHSGSFSLPLKLGTTSSVGVQDLLVYALTRSSSVGVSNVTEAPVAAADCMVALDEGQTLTDWWEGEYSDLSGLPADPLDLDEGQQGFTWSTEYSWGTGKCDPCPDDMAGGLDDETVESLGLTWAWAGYHFTRLHLRHTPGAVTVDPYFYETGISDQVQVKVVQHAWELESELPMCGDVQPEEPGACYTAEYWAKRSQSEALDEDLPTDDSYRRSLLRFGCDSPAGRSVLLLPLLLGLRRRERS